MAGSVLIWSPAQLLGNLPGQGDRTLGLIIAGFSAVQNLLGWKPEVMEPGARGAVSEGTALTRVGALPAHPGFHPVG